MNSKDYILLYYFFFVIRDLVRDFSKLEIVSKVELFLIDK